MTELLTMLDTLAIENVLPEHIRLGALADFPDEDWEFWHRYDNGKLATKNVDHNIPANCQLALQELALKVQPPAGSFWDMRYHGSGLHLMPESSHLGFHIDAEYHPDRRWRRVASLVYFLETTKGGELEIEGRRHCPIKNSAVMFKANMRHGVRTTQQTRRTLALFAWARDSGEKTTTRAQFERDQS